MLKRISFYILVLFSFAFLFSCFGDKDIDNEYTVSFYFVQGEEIKEYSQIVKHGEDLDFMLPLNEHEIEGMYFTSWKLNNFSYSEGQNFRVSRVNSDREYTFHPHFEEGYVFNEFILKLLEEEKCEIVDGSEVCKEVNEFEITGVGAKYKNLENYIIPEYGLNEIKITRIGNNSFRELDNLRAIELSNNITRIGDGAFLGCTSLEEIVLPNSVVYLGRDSFMNAKSLVNVQLSNSLINLNDRVFSGASSLTQIYLPSSIKQLGNSTFSGCENLATINLENITSIGNYTFSGCNSLVRVILSNGITDIAQGSFSNCKNLEEIVLPDNLIRIRDFAFMGSSKLKNIYIPKGVLTIGFSAFRDCDALEEIRLGHSSEPANWPTLETNAWHGNVNANIVWGASR
ncbi:TPA: leucine-rich repeat domain-containing protein [bacterium]|nr:leucine-rich repeat domain-containing protein [bacterium]